MTAVPGRRPPAGGGSRRSRPVLPRLAPRRSGGLPSTDDGVLRAATVTAGIAAVTALAAAALVPGWVAVLDAVAVAGCSALAGLAARDPRARPWRLAAWMVVAAATVWLVAAGPVHGDPPVVLGTLIAGFVAATAADQDGSRRSMLVNLALALAVLTLAAGVAPRSTLALPVLLGWGAGLVVLARADQLEQRLAADAVARPRRGSPMRRALAVPLLVSVLASAGVFALVRLGHPGQPPAGGGSGFAADWGGDGAGPPGRRTLGSYAGQSMDLRARGELPTTALLQVPATSPTLWRSGWLDRYTGQGWEVSQGTAMQRLGGGTVDLGPDPADPLPAGPVPAPLEAPVRLLGDPGYRVVPTPGIVESLRVPASADVLRLGAGGLMVEPTTEVAVTGYTAVSAARQVVDDPGAAAALSGATGPDPTQARWTQLPAELPARVRALGIQLAAGAPSRYVAVRRVEDYLRAHARYQLDSPVPAPGQDAVDDFLFVSGTGFCEQFASAETVLLRAAGIPARLAVGFSGGAPAGGLRTVRGSDAHAWVEVWFPGTGWAASDPTAGAAPAGADRGAVARWLATVLPAGIAAALASRWGLAALGALVVLAAALLVRTRRRRRREGSGPRPPGPPPRAGAGELFAAFGRYEAALAATGSARRREETLGELGARPAVDPAVVLALGSLERLLYAARPPGAAELVAAAAALDAAAARALVTARERARA